MDQRQSCIVVMYPLGFVQDLMARMGIQHLFEARVTAEDGTETIAESLLSAAYKLQRPPNQCVVFDGSPSGIAAAHNCTMKVRRFVQTLFVCEAGYQDPVQHYRLLHYCCAGCGSAGRTQALPAAAGRFDVLQSR